MQTFTHNSPEYKFYVTKVVLIVLSKYVVTNVISYERINTTDIFLYFASEFELWILRVFPMYYMYSDV